MIKKISAGVGLFSLALFMVAGVSFAQTTTTTPTPTSTTTVTPSPTTTVPSGAPATGKAQ